MKRLNESGLLLEAGSNPNARKAVLISQGVGSSGYYGPEFFTQENADALAGALSFPGHAKWAPERDPLSAIGWIGEAVTIEEDESGAKRFVSELHLAESKPEVGAYLNEFGKRLGLSIFIEGDGEYDSLTNVFSIKTLNGADPYRSVDLVVAAGRGGALLEGALPGTKNPFAEAQRRLALLGEDNASAPAEEKNEEENMTIEQVMAAVEAIAAKFDAFVATESTAAEAEVQAKVDQDAVDTVVESRLEQFAADSALINEAGLTESQKSEATKLAKSGGDVKSFVESAEKVLAEAKALVEGTNPVKARTAGHVTGSITESAPFGVSGFGKVR